jgi:hypothetical protein
MFRWGTRKIVVKKCHKFDDWQAQISVVHFVVIIRHVFSMPADMYAFHSHLASFQNTSRLGTPMRSLLAEIIGRFFPLAKHHMEFSGVMNAFSSPAYLPQFTSEPTIWPITDLNCFWGSGLRRHGDLVDYTFMRLSYGIEHLQWSLDIYLCGHLSSW